MKKDHLKEKTADRKERQKSQREAVMADRAQGFSEDEVQLRKEQRQAESRAQRSETLRKKRRHAELQAQRSEKFRKMNQTTLDQSRKEPEQVELNNLAAERNLPQE